MSSLRKIGIGMALFLTLGGALGCAESRTPAAGTNTSPECQGDRDCSAIEDGVCRGGYCVPSQPLHNSGPVDASTPDASTPDASTPDASAPASTDAGLSLTRVGAEVQVTDRYRTCGIDDDCVLVDTGCNGCCQQDAIRVNDRDAYQANFALACKAYGGPVCDCELLDLVPRCDNGQCRAVLRAETTCYSPTQNTELAFEPGAVGCACEHAGQSICSGAALICDPGSSGLTWTAVLDGPCARVVDCQATSPRASASACLAEFETCLPLGDGRFCGHGCYTASECDSSLQGCGPYEPFQCGTNGAGTASIREGQCGAVRFRHAGFGAGGYAAYWDAASGELLAYTETNDSFTYCGGAESSLSYGDLSVIQHCVNMDSAADVCP